MLPLPLHTTALRPSSLKSIFASLSSLPSSSLPEPIPPLAPDIHDIRRRSRRRDGGAVDRENEESGEKEEEENEEKQQEEPPNGELDRDLIYMAVATPDSTVVYYKLTKGIKKPADIPDE